MNPTRWIIVALIAALVIGTIYVANDPQMASRYAQMQRDAALSTEVKDLVMGGLVVLIGGYLAWFVLVRRRD